MNNYRVEPEISKASTLPGSIYSDQEAYDRSLTSVFAQSWQVLECDDLDPGKNCDPIILLSGSLDEPLLRVREHRDKVRILSNVCTHRGNILVKEPCRLSTIRCRYHGKCFDLNGNFKSMPGFETADHFPTDDDNLPQLPVYQLGPLTFCSIGPKISFDDWAAPMRARMNWFKFEDLHYCPELSNTYRLKAHWALYVENYLEGFHIPFVHEALNKALEFSAYRTEVFDYCNLQVGTARDKEPFFDLPTSSPDYGQKILAYYWWLFPNTMLNIYTWGISLNIVKPLGLDQTEIVFKTYLLPGVKPDPTISDGLNQTEMEDEAIVLDVQKGVNSRLYNRGRFSPTMEIGVHHFQRLLASQL